MSKRRINVDKYVSYNRATNKSTCLIETCKKELSGLLRRNIYRHYLLIHKLDIKSGDESDSEDVSFACKKSKGETLMFNIDMSKNDFLKCCIGLVTLKNMPFRILDDQEFFKQIIAPYEQKFNINLNSSYIETILENRSKNIKSNIAGLIKNKMICLKIDIASRLEGGVLGINIQYMQDFKIYYNTIGILQTNKYDTAENLNEKILKCLQEYDIGFNQIYSYTTDNGANYIKLSNLMDEAEPECSENEEVELDVFSCNNLESNVEALFSTVRCIPRSIQLVAYDVIKESEEDIDECRKVAKKLRAIVGTGDDTITIPWLDVITRWDTTYNLINKLFSLKDFVESLPDVNIAINWVFIENFITAFTPLAICSRKIQNEQYILGDFFRDWLNCELELGELASTNKYAKALLDGMTERKEAFLQHDVFVAALYLDPRFNFHGTPFLTEEHRHNAMAHLQEIYKLANNLKNPSRNIVYTKRSNSSIYNTPDDIPSSSTNAYDKLDFHVQNLLESQNISDKSLAINIKHKLMQLCDDERLPFGTNVVEYWQKLCSEDKEMAELVQTVLALPSTQISMAHSFSGLSTIVANMKSQLSKNTTSGLLIVKLNYELLDFQNFKKECNLSNVF